MALYDDKLDWYDFFIPGSQITPLFSSGGKEVGDLVNNITGATSTNQFNAQQAQLQRDFEERMSSTAYQRAIADIKQAGLNPAMLYASGGNGASTPSGANASGTKGGYMDAIGGTANLINSITNARRVDAITKSNELSASNARNMYKNVASITKMLTKWLT